MAKTNEELEREVLAKDLLLKMGEQAEKERDVSDKSYARKIVETAVFALIGLICITVIGYIIKSALK